MCDRLHAPLTGYVGIRPYEGLWPKTPAHDAAGALHALDDGRVLGRHVVTVERRAERGPHAPGDHEVLHRERYAVERAEPGSALHESSLSDFRLAPGRLLGQRHERIEP